MKILAVESLYCLSINDILQVLNIFVARCVAGAFNVPARGKLIYRQGYFFRVPEVKNDRRSCGKEDPKSDTKLVL